MFFAIANNLSLDFVNTVVIENGVEKDLLADFSRLLEWAAELKIIDEGQSKRLLHEWKGTPEAETAFSAALAVRSRMREMAVDLSHGRPVGEKVLDAINTLLRDRLGSTAVRQTEDGYEKVFIAEFRDPSQIVIPVAESAADLLCYGTPELVRKCENPECILYFYDISKNHRRRWCSMAGCGNRAKARAFYKRKAKSERSA